MKRFKKILYVSEPAVEQETAVARAMSLAESNQADLTVIDVIPEQEAGGPMPVDGPAASAQMSSIIADRRQALARVFAADAPQVNPVIEVLVGTRFLEVIRAVLREQYDLVIKPAENPGWLKRLFGSDDMHLLRKCPCPVWFMKPQEKHRYENIVAAVDFDPNWGAADDHTEQTLNQDILDLSSSLALSDIAKLHIAHAWSATGGGMVGMWAEDPEKFEAKFMEGESSRHRSGLNRLSRDLRKRIGKEAYEYLSLQTHLPQGPPRRVIPELARSLNADLIVMGTVARTGISGLFIGNTAEEIIEQLECSLLALKPPGFVTPVTLS